MSSPRHIVHIVGTLGAGGVQKLVLGLAASAPLRGHRHSVVCMIDDHGDLADEFAAAHVPAHGCPLWWPARLPIPSFRAGRWVRGKLERVYPLRLAKLLRDIDADLVHTHLTQRMELQLVGAALARRPVVWTVHGLYEPAASDTKRWLGGVRRVRPVGLRMTADSGPVATNFRARGLPDDIQVIHAGADVSRFSQHRDRKAGWREEHGIPADAVLFGTAGRLVEEKAHDVLVAAARRLVDEHPRAYVVIAGSGSLKSDLEKQIAELGLGERVRLLGFVADVPAFLRELDVFVLSSRREGFPLALIEALAAGLPCVATSVGGIDEMLGRSGGLVVPSEDVTALAHAMGRMTDAAARRGFAQSAASVAAQFSYDACGSAFSQVYEELWRRHDLAH